MNGGGGNVYGSSKINVGQDLSVTAPQGYKDKYDFHQKPWGLNPSRWARNIGTMVGSGFAGKGTAYDIYFYGKNRLTTLLPPK